MRKAYNGDLSNFRKKVYKKSWLDGDKDDIFATHYEEQLHYDDYADVWILRRWRCGNSEGCFDVWDGDEELTYLEAMVWINDWKEEEKPIWWES